MDSLTHIVLGAAVAEVVVGKKIGNKSLFLGAIAGNIPDFDSLISAFLNPADALFFHRGISHSLFALAVLVPILAIVVGKIDKDNRLKYADWLWLIALPWLSHLAVDLFNTYGTGIFEPFSSIRVAYDSVAIVDIFLLLVLIPTIILIYFLKQENTRRRIIAWISILFVVFYFGLSVVIKENLETRIKNELVESEKDYIRIQTAPLPLTNLIWMVTVEDSSGFDVDQRIIYDASKPLLKNRLLKNHDLIDTSCYEIEHIKHFTKGFYTVERTPDGWNIYDLRYSSLAKDYPDAYVFKFIIRNKNEIISLERAHPKRKIDIKNVKSYFYRLFQYTV